MTSMRSKIATAIYRICGVATLISALGANAQTVRSAYSIINAESHNRAMGHCVQNGDMACLDRGDYLRYDNIDFGSRGPQKLEVRLAVTSRNANQIIEVRLDSVSGPVIAQLKTAATGGSTVYQIQSTVAQNATGVHRVFFRFPGSRPTGPVDMMKFIEKVPTPPPPPPPSPSPSPNPSPSPTPPLPSPSPTPPPPSAACPANAIIVAVGESLQTKISAAPEGTSFCIRSGVHRMQSVTPKNDQKFYGEPGAILNGSRLLTGFLREGSLYYVTGQTQEGWRRGTGECLDEAPLCDRPEMFLINDQPLKPVESKAAVSAGKFYFDYAQDRIYFLDDPNGKKVEASVSPYAFYGKPLRITVKGFIVEKYSSSIQTGAIGYDIPTVGWTVQSNEVRWNYGVGIMSGSNSIALNNFIHNNGQMGMGGSGTNVTIEGNEIARNGYFSGMDPGWEGGGTKWSVSDGLLVRGNYSHHNNGSGLWTDIDNKNVIYENNRVEYNVGMGIQHEISYNAIIRNNTLKGNGHGFGVWLWGAQILVQNSSNVEVYGNRVEILPPAGNGIGLIQQNRGSGKYGPWVTSNNYVHHNTIIQRDAGTGMNGAVADYNAAAMFSSGNKFDFNSYYVADPNDDSWEWQGPVNFAELRSRGQELNGSVSPNTSIP